MEMEANQEQGLQYYWLTKHQQYWSRTEGSAESIPLFRVRLPQEIFGQFEICFL